MYKGYSVSANYVSDLGVGSSSFIFNSSVFVLGLLVLVGIYFLKNIPKLTAVKALLFLMALGAMGVGVFTKDFTIAHGAVSSAAVFFGGLSALTSGFFLKKPFSWISVALGTMTIGALALFSIGVVTSGSMTSTVAYDSNFYLGLGPGGMEATSYIYCSVSGASRSAVRDMRCYAAPESHEASSLTSTILPMTPPSPSNSCACLASARGNRRAISGLTF